MTTVHVYQYGTIIFEGKEDDVLSSQYPIRYCHF